MLRTSTTDNSEHAKVYSSKVPLPMGIQVPHLMHGCLGPGSPRCKRKYDQLSCFVGLTVVSNKQTDRHVDTPTTLLA